jgi:hypothetical protein
MPPSYTNNYRLVCWTITFAISTRSWATPFEAHSSNEQRLLITTSLICSSVRTHATFDTRYYAFGIVHYMVTKHYEAPKLTSRAAGWGGNHPHIKTSAQTPNTKCSRLLEYCMVKIIFLALKREKKVIRLTWLVILVQTNH